MSSGPTGRALDRVARRLAQRMQAFLGRCVLLAVRSGKMQGVQVQILAGEAREAEHFEPYGFTSVPLPGAEGVVIFPSGDRDHGIVVVLGDRRHRYQGLEPGEAALYHYEGHRVVLRNGGKVEVEATDLEAVLSGGAVVQAGGSVEVEAGGDVAVEAAGSASVEAQQVEVTAAVEVTVSAPIVKLDAQTIEAALGAIEGLVMEGAIDIINSHRHTESSGVTITQGPIEQLVVGVHSTLKLKGS